MRTYEKTHHWITFQIDFRQLNHEHWLLLGEAYSKCTHIAGAPLLPSVSEELHQVYLAKGVHATTAIEGNSLSEEEVRRQIEGNLDLPPSKEYLRQEINNILKGVNDIGDMILEGGSAELSLDLINAYNKAVLLDLDLPEYAVPGEIGKVPVGAGRYKGAPWEECEYLMDRLCEWLNGPEWPTGQDKLVIYGILKAILAHVYIAWIHPYGDGNGRAARLVEFHILLSVGVPAPAAHLLSNHYNETRNEYYRWLDHASKENDVFPFIQYALQGFVDGLKEHIDTIQGFQLIAHWRNHIYNSFQDKEKPTDVRRRHLILDLSFAGKEGPFKTVADFRHITPRMAEAYAGKTAKTIKRDLAELFRMDLLQRAESGGASNIPCRNSGCI